MKTLTMNIRIADNGEFEEKQAKIVSETSGIAGVKVQIKKAGEKSCPDFLELLEKYGDAGNEFYWFYPVSGNKDPEIPETLRKQVHFIHL